VLTLAYNVLTGGICLEDIERLRNDETYMHALSSCDDGVLPASFCVNGS
jgi:hypothetical protein